MGKTILEMTGARRVASPRVEPSLRGRYRLQHRHLRLLEVLEVLEVLLMFLRKYTERKPGGRRRQRERIVSRVVSLLRKRAQLASVRPEKRTVPGQSVRREIVRRVPRAV